jgi:hypothetical protein
MLSDHFRSLHRSLLRQGFKPDLAFLDISIMTETVFASAREVTAGLGKVADAYPHCRLIDPPPATMADERSDG